MFNFRSFKGLVFVFEDKWENQGQDQGIACKSKPNALPVLNAVHRKMVNYPAANNTSEERPQSVGHNHKQALGAGSYFWACFFFDEQGSGNIKEIEGHSVNDHGEHEQIEAVCGVSYSEEPKAEHPGNHTENHYFFYSETFQEKWDC